MNDLIKKISEKFALNENQSSQAVKMVLEYLKDNLPETAGAQINEILISWEGEQNPGNGLNDLGPRFTTK